MSDLLAGLTKTDDDSLLTEIRENFDYCVITEQDIRKDGQTDMKYLSGDPWPDSEKISRSQQGMERPMLVFDELNQYVNDLVNDVRLNKRAIEIIPKGSGANDKTAELQADLIRAIEYKSNAQAAYCTGFENAVSRSYGYWKVTKRFVDPKSFDQELRIVRIPNPDTIYLSPDATEADRSDGLFAFELDSIKRKTFEATFPKAKAVDFSSSEYSTVAPKWVRGDELQIASYWRVEAKDETLYMVTVAEGQPPVNMFLSEFGKGAQVFQNKFIIGADNKPAAILMTRPNGDIVTRETQSRSITQYVTNGFEILKKIPWDGKYIPLVGCYGKEIYVDNGTGPTRKLMSLTRLGRDPYMLYCYYRTAQAELAGQSPLSPWVGYEGQFQGHENEWQYANKSPKPFLQVKPLTMATGNTVLPLPQRNVWEPPLQALEIAAEAARRAIQAAMGISALPTAALRRNEKSGVALEHISEQQSKGSFHFIDGFDVAIEYTGRILLDLAKKTYDTDREVALRGADEKFKRARLNVPYVDDQTKQPVHYDMQAGEHDVTVTTGPSYQSQRDEADKFLDKLSATALFPQVADLVVKMKNLGPIGNEIAKRLTPPQVLAEQQGGQQLPPNVIEAFQKLNLNLRALNAFAQKLEKENEEYKAGIRAKEIDAESREKVAMINSRGSILEALIQQGGENARAEAENHIKALDRALDQLQHETELEHEAEQAELDRQAAPPPGEQPEPEASPAQ